MSSEELVQFCSNHFKYPVRWCFDHPTHALTFELTQCIFGMQCFFDYGTCIGMRWFFDYPTYVLACYGCLITKCMFWYEMILLCTQQMFWHKMFLLLNIC